MDSDRGGHSRRNVQAATGLNVRFAYLARHRTYIPTLAAWHHAEWSHLYPGETLEAFREHLEHSAQTEAIPLTIIALVEGKLAGSASLIEHDLDSRPELSPWLANVYVAPPFRRHGLGTLLIERIQRAAARLGVKTLYLFTENQAPFYARLGWRTLSQEQSHGAAITIMIRTLPRIDKAHQAS